MIFENIIPTELWIIWTCSIKAATISELTISPSGEALFRDLPKNKLAMVTLTAVSFHH